MRGGENSGGRRANLLSLAGRRRLFKYILAQIAARSASLEVARFGHSWWASLTKSWENVGILLRRSTHPTRKRQFVGWVERRHQTAALAPDFVSEAHQPPCPERIFQTCAAGSLAFLPCRRNSSRLHGRY